MWYLDKYYTGSTNFRVARNFDPSIEEVYNSFIRNDYNNVTFHVNSMRQMIRDSQLCSAGEYEQPNL